jgi:hypothetical protein
MSEKHETTQQDQGEDAVSGIRTIGIEAGRSIDLLVENPNGDVLLRLADREDVLVQWDKRGRPGSTWYDEATVQIRQEGDNRIAVKVSLPAVWPSGDFGKSVLKFLEGGLKDGNPFGMLTGGRVSFDLTVELPRAAVTADPARVRIRTANGDVKIDEFVGTVDVTTANGEVETNRTNGEVSIHAANGDLTMNYPKGTVTARTVSGDLTVFAGDLSRFTLNTVNGDTTVQTALTGDASRIDGVNGDVRLDLIFPAATGGTLSVRSVTGDTHVEAPFRSVAKRTWRIGPGGEGGPSVAVKTVSGDLEARGKLSDEVDRPVESIIAIPPRPPEPPRPPAAPDGPTVPDEAVTDPRLAVLQAVERGEIDIDEAMRRLEGLGGRG